MTPEQLRERLKEMAKNHGPAVSNIAQVKSVDLEKQSCVLIDEDGLELFDVRLRPVLNENKSILIVPKLKSFVLAVRVEDDDDWMVIGYDEIESFHYQTEKSVFAYDDAGFLLQKENETLKKLMTDLIAAIKNISFTVTTPDTINGTTTQLVNLNDFESVETRFKAFLK